MKIILRALWEELVLSIVVMDTVAEEYPFGISLELGPVFTGTVTFIVLENILKRLADLEIIFAVLHPDNVTAIFRRLRKMIDILLLLKRKRVPSRYLVPHDLKVCKFIYEIFEFSVLRRFIRAGHQGRGQASNCNHLINYHLHIYIV